MSGKNILTAVVAGLFLITLSVNNGFAKKNDTGTKGGGKKSEQSMGSMDHGDDHHAGIGSGKDILVFANWGSSEEQTGLWHLIYSNKWLITSLFSLALSIILMSWYNLPKWQVILAALPAAVLALTVGDQPIIAFVAAIIGLSVLISRREDETGEWFKESWGFAKQILPLLLFGVLVAGILLGRPGNEGLVPSEWVSKAVGGNSLLANFVASFAGAFMYFATLTEVPILQGLIGNGMGKGPALALLLAGPALSLPNMLVIRSIMGTKKTIVFVVLVIIMATISGYLYGIFY